MDSSHSNVTEKDASRAATTLFFVTQSSINAGFPIFPLDPFAKNKHTNNTNMNTNIYTNLIMIIFTYQDQVIYKGHNELNL